MQKKIVHKKNLQDLSRLTNRKSRDEFIENINKDADELNILKKRLKKVEREYFSYQNKKDRLTKLKKAVECSNYKSISGVISPVKGKLLQFLYYNKEK